MPAGQRTAAASSKRVQQGEATRAVLIETAQRLFAEHGYAATSTTDIVTAAEVTRGALYHHFADKEDLFRAVLEATEAEPEGADQDLIDELQAMVERGMAARTRNRMPQPVEK